VTSTLEVFEQDALYKPALLSLLLLTTISVKALIHFDWRRRCDAKCRQRHPALEFIHYCHEEQSNALQHELAEIIK